MLKLLAMYWYVEDVLAAYVPANAHGLLLAPQRFEAGVLTHKSLLPVSICSLTAFAGVPTVALMK